MWAGTGLGYIAFFQYFPCATRLQPLSYGCDHKTRILLKDTQQKILHY